jgi:hypothetical protein
MLEWRAADPLDTLFPDHVTVAWRALAIDFDGRVAYPSSMK